MDSYTKVSLVSIFVHGWSWYSNFGGWVSNFYQENSGKTLTQQGSYVHLSNNLLSYNKGIPFENQKQKLQRQKISNWSTALEKRSVLVNIPPRKFDPLCSMPLLGSCLGERQELKVWLVKIRKLEFVDLYVFIVYKVENFKYLGIFSICYQLYSNRDTSGTRFYFLLIHLAENMKNINPISPWC